MRYPLDVSALIALGIVRYEFHNRVLRWLRSQRGATLLTCPITELGFVRIVSQASTYGYTVAESRNVLAAMKRTEAFQVSFIADAQNASHLPAWVKSSGQTTDGHLAELAKRHGAVLATLDRGIPGAFVIPD